jgi:isopentenyl-diphosphate Delta-isomerase
VFGGTYEGAVSPDPAEVADWKWIPLATLMHDLERHPEHYTIWFRHYLREHIAEIGPWMEAG